MVKSTQPLVSGGFTFVEVMVSLLLLILLIFGFDALQLAAVRISKANLYATIATQQLDNLTRIIEFAPADYQSYLSQWNHENKTLLPRGHGSITVQGDLRILTITWGKVTRSECKKSHISLSGCLRKTLITRGGFVAG